MSRCYTLQCEKRKGECIGMKTPVAAYKLSRYNNIMWDSGHAYLWNSFSNALLRLDADALLFIDRYDGQDQSDNMYFDLLRRNQCIVPADLNELNQVLFDEKAAIMNPHQKVLHFTLALGLGCNYDCVYCFEKHRESHAGMTPEIQDLTADYILRLAEENPSLEHLMIRWFGGEPLLYMDAITRISERLIPWCEEHHIHYYAEIITNGRFLTLETAQRLRQYRIQFVQLAVDGMPEYYMAQKRTAKGDFEATVDNIVQAADILPIQVRINIADQYQEAFALAKYLLIDRKLDGKIQIRVAHVRNFDQSSSEEELARHTRFLDFELEFMKLFDPDGPYSPKSLSFPVPRRQPANCYKICSSNFSIGPEGELYRCEHHLGRPELAVGSITGGLRYPDEEIHSVCFTHPQKCLDCTVLPVCLSGCLFYPNLAMSCERYREERFQLLLRSCRSS